MSTHPLFIGPYTTHGSKGIYSLRFDSATGELSAPILAAETSGPTYLALSPDGRFLYAVNDSPALAVGYAIGADRASLSPLAQSPAPAGKAPSHLAVDRTGRVLLVAHYHEGYVASLPLAPDGSVGLPASVIRHAGSSVNPERQSAPHPHSVTVSPDNRHVIVCDLGLDKIFTYRLDANHATLSPAEPPFLTAVPGAGPRHFAFSPDGRHAFMLAEMGGTLTSYAYDAAHGSLHAIDTNTALPGDFVGENKSAAVRVHPNGRFVYASNRGPDTLAVFSFDSTTGRLALVESVPSGGVAPRDFALSPDGAWLIAAHQDSNDLTAFRVDSSTGRLTRTPATAEISLPVCVVFAG